VYCVDCEQTLCRACQGHLHHPGMHESILTHSIESIIQVEYGVRILSPLWDKICIMFVGIFFGRQVGISQDYLHRVDMCPAVHVAQDFVAWLDTLFLYYYKDFLIRSCGIEDSFWKFTYDMWVRSIVTDSDDSVLLLATLPQALLFESVCTWLLVPVVSWLYASTVLLLHIVERRLPELNALLAWERIVVTCNERVAFLGFVETNCFETKPRYRPSKNISDAFHYWTGRQIRWFRFHSTAAKAYLRTIAARMVGAVVIIRVSCIVFRAGWFFRLMCKFVGLQNKIELHQSWFQGRTTSMINTDPIVHRTIQLGGKYMHRIASSITWHDINILVTGFLCILAFDFCFMLPLVSRVWEVQSQTVGTWLKVVLALLAVFMSVHMQAEVVCVAIIVFAGVWTAKYMLAKANDLQHKRFKKVWEENFRTFVGDCGANDEACPCLSTLPRPNRTLPYRFSFSMHQIFTAEPSQPDLGRTVSSS